VVLLLLLSLLAAVSIRLSTFDGPPTLSEFRKRTPVLGTFATYIVVTDSGSAQRILSSMDSLAGFLDNELGVFGSGELSLLNSSGKAALSGLSADMKCLIETSFLVSGVTDSLFDPAMGVLVSVWGFPDSPRLPDTAEIEAAMAVSGLRHLRMEQDTLYLDPGTLLDLGAVAKGYVCDRIYSHARGLGAASVLVEIGGEIRCGGDADPGRTWRLAVRDPRGEGTLETLEMDSGAVATSGDYESFFCIGGRRYSHILDPRTGYPETGTASVTVVSNRASVADALATALSVGGVPAAEKVPDSLFSLMIVISEDENGATFEWRRESR
jgi:thiamine biosynthesis lipoprotein